MRYLLFLTPFALTLIFAQPVISQTGQGVVVIEPGWRRSPTTAEIDSFYPARARAAGISGFAIARCDVPVSGGVSNCIVFGESPEGHGFGEAALAASQLFQVTPKRIDGEAVGRGVVAIKFSWGGSSAESPRVQRCTGDGGNYYPQRARNLAVEGSAAIRCRISEVGLLQGCRMVSEEPAGYGFGQATMCAATRFKIRPEATNSVYGPNAEVTIPLQWRLQ